MDVTPLVKEGAQIIQGYSETGFRVSGTAYDSGVLVFAEKTLVWDVGADVKALALSDFQPLIDVAADVDVVLLGTGKSTVFPDPTLKKALKAAGVHIEVMDNGAVCRTYNVLMAEGRRVVAALLPF